MMVLQKIRQVHSALRQTWCALWTEHQNGKGAYHRSEKDGRVTVGLRCYRCGGLHHKLSFTATAGWRSE